MAKTPDTITYQLRDKYAAAALVIEGVSVTADRDHRTVDVAADDTATQRALNSHKAFEKVEAPAPTPTPKEKS